VLMHIALNDAPYTTPFWNVVPCISIFALKMKAKLFFRNVATCSPKCKKRHHATSIFKICRLKNRQSYVDI